VKQGRGAPPSTPTEVGQETAVTERPSSAALLALVSAPNAPNAARDALILERGIHDEATLRAVLSLPDKSSGLITQLLDDVARHLYPPSANEEGIFESVLGEAALNQDHLRALAFTIARWVRVGPSTLAAICSHELVATPAVGPEESRGWVLLPVVAMLRGESQEVAREVARLSGSFLPAALWWVLGRPNVDRVELVDRVADVASRWAGQSAGNPALVSFLMNASFDFTSEADLFAAGAAICAAPART